MRRGRLLVLLHINEREHVTADACRHGLDNVQHRCRCYCGVNGIPAFSQTNSTAMFGWTAGAGLETALTDRWVARGEYRYSDYGHWNTTFGTPANLAVAANIHGRGLTAPPFIGDLESLEIVTAEGEVVRCSRQQQPELFRHVVGGYGLFGVVTAATLRLTARQQVERSVELCEIEGLIDRLRERIAAGALYGDFQFATDPTNTNFLRTGILSCYLPTGDVKPIPPRQRRLSQADWNRLIELAHRDKTRAFEEFSDFYLATSGQRYWSDTHQLNLYLESYHAALDQRLGGDRHGGEMITELYVPRDRLSAFMDDVRRDLLRHPADVIYGTIRLIEKDTESALPWAREPYACVIFNLHVDHQAAAIADAASAFVRLIDHAIAHQGSYFLTYHRFARPDQVFACHPGLRRWLTTKHRIDPYQTFQSDWYQHLLRLTGKEAA